MVVFNIADLPIIGLKLPFVAHSKTLVESEDANNVTFPSQVAVSPIILRFTRSRITISTDRSTVHVPSVMVTFKKKALTLS